MRTKFITLFALMLCVGALFFTGTAYASDGGEAAEILTVDEVYLEGDTLHIQVTDANTGVNQTLELNLREYADDSEYVSVQAIDRSGNKSNVIQFKNPYYVARADAPGQGEIPPVSPDAGITPGQSESFVPGGNNAADGQKPFTPDGTGEVVDNVTNGEGKEFFSIKTDDGNVFYLIVDRQRTSDNVYLLNAVTEDDLASLAKSGDGKTESAIPGGAATAPAQTATPAPEVTPEPPAAPAKEGGINSGALIFILIAVAAVGGAGYYFKVVRPKQAADTDSSDDYDDEPEDADEEDEYEDIDDGEGDEDE